MTLLYSAYEKRNPWDPDPRGRWQRARRRPGLGSEEQSKRAGPARDHGALRSRVGRTIWSQWTRRANLRHQAEVERASETRDRGGGEDFSGETEIREGPARPSGSANPDRLRAR